MKSSPRPPYSSGQAGATQPFAASLFVNASANSQFSSCSSNGS